MSDLATPYTLKRAEAVAMIKRAPAGVTFRMHVDKDLPIENAPGKIFANAGHTYVTLTRKDAMRIADGLFGQHLEMRGARLRLVVREYAMFDGRKRVSYWIG